jgi:hypothetical protein
MENTGRRRLIHILYFLYIILYIYTIIALLYIYLWLKSFSPELLPKITSLTRVYQWSQCYYSVYVCGLGVDIALRLVYIPTEQSIRSMVIFPISELVI